LSQVPRDREKRKLSDKTTWLGKLFQTPRASYVYGQIHANYKKEFSVAANTVNCESGSQFTVHTHNRALFMVCPVIVRYVKTSQ